MPMGKGTYGSKVGRPPKKKKKNMEVILKVQKQRKQGEKNDSNYRSF